MTSEKVKIITKFNEGAKLLATTGFNIQFGQFRYKTVFPKKVDGNKFVECISLTDKELENDFFFQKVKNVVDANGERVYDDTGKPVVEPCENRVMIWMMRKDFLDANKPSYSRQYADNRKWTYEIDKAILVFDEDEYIENAVNRKHILDEEALRSAVRKNVELKVVLEEEPVIEPPSQNVVEELRQEVLGRNKLLSQVTLEEFACVMWGVPETDNPRLNAIIRKGLEKFYDTTKPGVSRAK